MQTVSIIPMPLQDIIATLLIALQKSNLPNLITKYSPTYKVANISYATLCISNPSEIESRSMTLLGSLDKTIFFQLLFVQKSIVFKKQNIQTQISLQNAWLVKSTDVFSR